MTILGRKQLAGFVSEYEQGLVRKEMHERVHVVWLCLFQDLHRYVRAAADTITVEDFISRIVVLVLERVQAIQTARSDENRSICKCLNRCIPSFGRQFLVRLFLGIIIFSKPPDSIETIGDGWVKEVKRSVTAISLI